MSFMIRILGLCLFCAACFGCSGASWQKVEIDSPYQAPKVMNVAIVARPTMKAASDALASALLDRLDSYDIKATVVPETSGKADLTVSIVKWEPGSQATRWLTAAFGGKGEVVVVVSSLALDGTAEGWVRGGLLGGQDVSSAEAVASLIAYSVATGQQSKSQASKAQAVE